MVNRENSLNELLFPLTLFTLGLFCVKCPGECVGFNHCKYFQSQKSYVNEFLHCNTTSCQILNWKCKVFVGFSRYLVVKRLKIIILNLQNICNLIGSNTEHISDIFNCYSANINGMWNARKLGGIYKTLEFILNLKCLCVGIG